MKEHLEQCFSNFNVHMDPWGGLVNVDSPEADLR